MTRSYMLSKKIIFAIRVVQFNEQLYCALVNWSRMYLNFCDMKRNKADVPRVYAKLSNFFHTYSSFHHE